MQPSRIRLSPSALVAMSACAAAGIALPGAARAVTFDTLPGPSGSTFITHVEDGVTVQSQFGAWRQSLDDGNAGPSIYISVQPDDNTFGSLDVLSMGELFTFESVDLRALGSDISYQVGGSRNGIYLFSFSSDQLASPGFQTVMSTSSLPIDMLRIDISLQGLGSFHVDNLQVQVVPEPAVNALIVAGLAVVGWAARRSRAPAR